MEPDGEGGRNLKEASRYNEEVGRRLCPSADCAAPSGRPACWSDLSFVVLPGLGWASSSIRPCIY
jgi:hypothetical protein